LIYPTSGHRTMPDIDQLGIAANVDGILNRWPAVGPVGAVPDGALEFFSGHGVANIESATPVTEGTVFRIGLRSCSLRSRA
jgi:hypothetical protein